MNDLDFQGLLQLRHLLVSRLQFPRTGREVSLAIFVKIFGLFELCSQSLESGAAVFLSFFRFNFQYLEIFFEFAEIAIRPFALLLQPLCEIDSLRLDVPL